MSPILPGKTIGILGGGQLGRMTAMAAKRMGYGVHIFTPEGKDAPAAQVSDRTTVAAFEDEAALLAFARSVDVVTLEFENIPFTALEVLERYVPVRPNHEVLYVTQNRIREKVFLRDAGLPVTPFYPIRRAEDLDAGLARLGCPAILKTAGFGYDGKGQAKIPAAENLDAFYAGLGGQDGILERMIAFETEFSVVAARGVDGEFAHFGVIENLHRDHILDISVSPAPHLADIEPQAVEIARAVLEKLNVIGVLCIEFFLAADRCILINELAPRPHNSGHLTIEGFATSQFEQQVRAVCGLPLGSTEPIRPAAMANLLGDAWFPHPPDWTRLAPDVKWHLYGKAEPRAGRKMGHLTVLADTPAQARARVEQARNTLGTSVECGEARDDERIKA